MGNEWSKPAYFLAVLLLKDCPVLYRTMYPRVFKKFLIVLNVHFMTKLHFKTYFSNQNQILQFVTVCLQSVNKATYCLRLFHSMVDHVIKLPHTVKYSKQRTVYVIPNIAEQT